VVDLEEEQREAKGMVIHSDQWPDRMFAPPKRTEFLADRVNPVYDKEMRSELFGHGTLMLRIVIQSSMFLALAVMAVCLFIFADKAPWYVSYVLLFNMLVGPVFAAGSVTSERERETLELLLTTTLSPWQILAGKLVSSLRVSCVLTSFLVWPILLAWVMPPWTFLDATLTLATYVVIILVTSLTTTTLAMFCSVIFRRTPVAMMTSYLLIVLLFAVPVAAKVLVDQLYPTPTTTAQGDSGGNPRSGAPINVWIGRLGFTSPFAATFSLPLKLAARDAANASTGSPQPAQAPSQRASWEPITAATFLLFYLVLDVLLIGAVLWLFNIRWRVAQ